MPPGGIEADVIGRHRRVARAKASRLRACHPKAQVQEGEVALASPPWTRVGAARGRIGTAAGG